MKHMVKLNPITHCPRRKYKPVVLELDVYEAVALTTFLKEMRLRNRYEYLRPEAESISHKLGEWEFEKQPKGKMSKAARARTSRAQKARWAARD